jgi:uncharacterized protein YebE (UPF0316 family)
MNCIFELVLYVVELSIIADNLVHFMEHVFYALHVCTPK